MGLRDIELSLPAGFRFCPSDEELICHYLQKKVANEKVSQGTMVEVDLHTNEPWELPEVAKLGENEWYFFSFRDRKYATGPRTNRATKSGYWKATGKDRTVYHPKTGAVAGMRKTLVFHSGRAPNGTNTSWVMHEFRLQIALNAPPKEDWVLCRVFQKKKGDPLMRHSLDQNEQDNSIASRFDCFSSQMDSSSLPQQDVQIPNGRMCLQRMTPLFPFVEHHESNNNSNTYLDLHALLQCNFLRSPHEPEKERMMQVGTKAGGDDDDDDGGMMFDVNLEGHDLLLQGMDDFGGMSSLQGGKDQNFF